MSAPRPVSLARAGLLFLFALLFAGQLTAATMASASAAGIGGPTSSRGFTATTDSDSEGSVEVPASMRFDADGVPYLDTVRSAPAVTSVLAKQLAAAKEIDRVYIDDSRDVVVLVTTGGVILTVIYGDSADLLQSLFDAEVIPSFVTFEPAPIPVTGSSEKSSRSSGVDLMRFGLLLPFVITIGGAAIIYELAQRRKRGDGKVEEGTTQFQTREGNGGVIPTVTFADVAGCEEAIEDLGEVVEFLRDPERFERLGAKVPRGAILAGPPGTGKTLLARAVAGEAQVPFFTASGSDFVEMYVGVGPARVRELFAKARAAEKAIVFIDEIDAVARSRAMSTRQNANDERENTLNALLNELDGFSRSNVILLAATNRVDILDPAILRPGRLDRKIHVPNPDRRGREKILAIHTDGKPLAKDVDLSLVAKRTPGMSGAELAQIANEAAIEAARRGLKSVNAACFSAAVALVSMGRARRSALVTDRDRLITAYHEAGHTVCALLHPDAPDPVSVSITPRGHAGGVTMMTGTDDQYLARKQAAAHLVVAMGGRVGEERLLEGEFTQGPSSDLERATQLATTMVTRYGMTRRGLAVRTGEPDRVSHDVIEELLNEALTEARSLIDANQPLFNAIVNQLLEHETLESSEIYEIAASLSGDDGGGERSGGFGSNPILGQVLSPVKGLQAAGQAAVAAASTAKERISKGRRPGVHRAKSTTSQASPSRDGKVAPKATTPREATPKAGTPKAGTPKAGAVIAGKAAAKGESSGRRGAQGSRSVSGKRRRGRAGSPVSD